MKITTKPLLAILTTTISAFLVFAPPSEAASINWGAATTISGNSDVSTSGSLVGAFNVGDGGVSAATVNGVTFAPFALNSTGGPVSSGTVGNFTLSTSDLFLSDNTFYGSTSAPFSALSAAYKTILSSATITGTPATFSLTMAGLTVGQPYQFQWWAATAHPLTNANGLPVQGSDKHSATAGGNTVILDDNPSGLEGGLGQFAIGTFVANASFQTVTFAPFPPTGGQEFAQLNAFQLRSVAPSVPETASLLAGMLPLGVLLLGRVIRRGATTAVKV